MVKLVFFEYLPAPPQAVWSFITDPQYINTWSTAFIETLEPGDRSQAASIGGTRQVTINIPGGDIILKEVIEHCQPPKRFVYRVFQGKFIRYHRGEIQLIPQGEKTLLRWDVDYEFFLPILPKIARIILEEQITQSLKQLAKVVKNAPVKNFPSLDRNLDESQKIPELWERAEKVLLEQRMTADRLAAAGDPKCWFTRVYEYVTEYQLQACREGRITHQGWLLRLIPRFHDYYYDNLMRWMGETSGLVESQWRIAFQAMEEGKYEDGDARAFVYGLMKGVEAHIEEDLPRALAEVYYHHYSHQFSYARFRADYILMADIFYKSAHRLQQELPERYFPSYMKMLNTILPLEIQGGIISKYFYDIPQRRLLAFERGERLVNFMTESHLSTPFKDADNHKLARLAGFVGIKGERE
ncbi:SRPBCC family protein [Calothrix sp. 336/3]|uniref:SRPBCC family protein n=1 Tax=Calothrix sp. 336/3 TaxID=1337936 RepID=UPI00143C7B54|nr:SRPBCC family protein [Calothrix sp. 336/3]